LNVEKDEFDVKWFCHFVRARGGSVKRPFVEAGKCFGGYRILAVDASDVNSSVSNFSISRQRRGIYFWRTELTQTRMAFRTASGMRLISSCVCALKRSKEAIEKAMKRIDGADARKRRESSAEARQFNEYIAVITTLPYSINADEALAAYRYKWQVELYFKRLKSLLGTGELVPMGKFPPRSNRP
jgi:hypothetical protein